MAVLSPGIDPVSRLVRNFSSRGIDIIGELELGWRFCQKIPVIAVTGTNGKTTTTELLAQIDRKSTRLNSSHSQISYAVFCLKKKLMLFAIYGLRASEVAQLRLDDLDWDHDLLRVARAKRHSPQLYPLVATVGNALLRYIRHVRPACGHRAVFLSLVPPIRPLSRSALYNLTRTHFQTLGIHATHLGPHALRHSCATRLAAAGVSLKAIGDHLGHRSPSATRIYTKVDLPALRQVAAFDVGELL